LDLKICDMAMGSAAFLVQVCRWLGERLVEAWEAAERDGKAISADGKVLEARAGHDLLPPDRDERLSLARRLIAERCVYGVDINPMAVELAKLSLWLVTLAKGRPFGFLDHNLRCGDSLLGITSLEQVENFHLDPAKGRELHKGLFDPKHRIQAAVSKASELRRQLCGTRILDIEDVRSMARLDAEAKQLFAAPELVADVLLGAAVQGDESTDDLLKSIADDLQRALVHGGNDAERVRHRARELLDADCPERLKPRRPFHWAIEFPEVFGRDRSGFDAVVGNPPFLYGKRVSGVLGSGYSDHLSAIHRPATKNVDFSMHFVRRAATLVREAGTIGIIATSSIAEGQTREAGLDWMLHNNFSIYSADARLSWPGRAAVLISRISLMRGSWSGNTTLDCRRVESISAYLTADATFAPVPLTENEGLAFRGVVPNGMGFVIDHEQATEFIRVRPRNRKVVLPYLIGEDVNTDPEQRPSRWIINFWDWNRETAEEYVEPFQWVRKHVKPHRDQMGEQKKSVKDRWWQFEAVGRDLFTAIGRRDVFQNAQSRTGRLGNASPLRRVIGIARVSKTGAFTFLSNDAVFCEVTVIASDDAAVLALLQSSVHMVFAWAIAGRMKNDLRYSPTACLQAFPFPRDVGAREKLSQLGEALTECRTAAMNTRQIGLTKLYKLVHQVTCKDPDIQSLREIQKQIDLQTALSYGWTLNLEHGFHNVGYLPESDRCRFTVSEVARTELLARLSLLNRQRALEHAQSCAWFSETHSFGSVSGASRSNKRSTSQANAMDTDPSFELIALNPGAAKGSGTSTRRRRQ
jgi:hypothetical protein